MATRDIKVNRRIDIGAITLRFRLPVGIILLAISAVMGYYATKVQIATRFDDFFPRYHPNVLLYEKYQRFGGAQTVVIMLHVKQGDIFNVATLKKIQGLQNDVNRLPGVNHQQVFSLASYRAVYSEAVPGGIEAKTFMFPNVPANQEELDQLKKRIFPHRAEVGHLISYDDKSAIVTASFNEQGLDYDDLFKQIQALVKKYSDSNHEMFLAGEPVVRGYGYFYFAPISICFVSAIVLMLVILYLRVGERTSWWAPIVTGTLSATWGLGFIGIMGYNFDPVMLVIPFLLTARDFSHGIQWQGRYYDELDRLHDRYQACIAATNAMLPPGFLSIIADISGIIFISFAGIPVLQHIALAGSVWLAGSLTMVFVFQPIFMSYLPTPRRRWVRTGFPALARLTDRVIGFTVTPGAGRATVLAVSAAFVVWGLMSGLHSKIGYSAPGTPLYRPNSKVNTDIREIGKYFPVDEGWVILTTPQYPDEQSVLGPRVLRMMDDLHDYMMQDSKVAAVVTFSSELMKLRQMFHSAHPKYLSVPTSVQESGNLWYLFLSGTAPGEMERFISTPQANDTCVRLLLRDHTYDTLNRVQERLHTFMEQRVQKDPALSNVKFLYLAGLAGLYASANDVMFQLDLINITFVLAVVFLFCAIFFRSIVAAVMFFVACVMANFAAFIYMGWRDIGLTIDTIPVISLGIGLGVDYGIYHVARIRDEVMGGLTTDDAIVTALHTTGDAVLTTFAVMVGGLIPWTASPLLFHSQMSILLIFLMFTNMVAGVLILPCFISWARPPFISRYEVCSSEAAAAVAGS